MKPHLHCLLLIYIKTDNKVGWTIFIYLQNLIKISTAFFVLSLSLIYVGRSDQNVSSLVIGQFKFGFQQGKKKLNKKMISQ